MTKLHVHIPSRNCFAYYFHTLQLSPTRELSGPALALQGHEVPGPAGPGLVGLAKSRGPAGPGSGRAREKSRP